MTTPQINKEPIELYILYGSAASEAMFDFPCHYFRIPNCIGTIAYRVEHKCAIIFGDPLCPPNELPELTQAFHKFCSDSHLNIIYIAVSEKFAKLAREYCKILIEGCEEIIFDPQIDPTIKSHRLQHRIDKAVKHGLTFHEYIPFDKDIENSLLEIGSKWQKAKKGPRVFLGHLNFFEIYKGKRWFYVKDEEQITSMAMLCRLEAQEGWFLKFLFTVPNAFPETSEFLMISLLRTLKRENCHYLTKGLAPIDAIGELKGLGYLSFLVKYAYNFISYFMKFKVHNQYYQRYFPKKAHSYIFFANSKIRLNEIRALFKVFKVD